MLMLMSRVFSLAYAYACAYAYALVKTSLYQILPTGSILTDIFAVNGNSRITKRDKSLRGITTNLGGNFRRGF